MIKFSQINIVAANVARSIAFYRLLGFTIDTSRPFKDHHINVTDDDGASLEIDSRAFARVWNKGARDSDRNGSVIGFDVDTREAVDALFKRMMDAGYKSQQEPYDAFWGSRYAVIEDPDGNPVGLMSPQDDNFRSPTPVV